MAPASLQHAELMFLALELDVFPGCEETYDNLLARVSRSALRTTGPVSVFGQEISEKLKIRYGKTDQDCMGFYESSELVCSTCKDQNTCRVQAETAGMGFCVGPALKTFRVPTEIKTEFSTQAVEETDDLSENSSETDRAAYIDWLKEKYPSLKFAFNSESVSIFSNTLRAVLKVKNFGRTTYSVRFPQVSRELATKHDLLPIKSGFCYAGNDLTVLKAVTEECVSEALARPTKIRETSVDRSEISELIRKQGLVVEDRRKHLVAKDELGYCVLYVRRFSPRGYKVAFPRMKKEVADRNGLKSTRYGPTFRGKDRAQLDRLMTAYFQAIKPKKN